MRPSRSPRGSRPTHATSPAATRRSRSAGRYPSTRAGRISRSSSDAGTGAPCNCSTTSSNASRPARRRATPCHVATKRPSAPASTGSTCLRSRASDRSRSVPSTSRPHHSRSRPPGLNSPCTTRPEAASAASAASTAWRGSPRRAAHVADVKGPCVRANRCTRSPSGSATGSSSAFGRPGELNAQRVAVSRRVLDGHDARLTGDWQLDGTARGDEVVDRADQ